MPTLYSEIHDDFLRKITDYDLPNFDVEDKESILKSFMVGACSKFKRLCKSKLADRDEILAQFNQTLSEEEIDIISELMIVEWLKPKYLMSENMATVLNTKDYNQASPANMLKENRDTYNSCRQEAKRLMIEYSYINGGIGDISTKK